MHREYEGSIKKICTLLHIKKRRAFEMQNKRVPNRSGLLVDWCALKDAMYGCSLSFFVICYQYCSRLFSFHFKKQQGKSYVWVWMLDSSSQPASSEERNIVQGKKPFEGERAATMMLLENNCNPITLSFFENLKALKKISILISCLHLNSFFSLRCSYLHFAFDVQHSA